MLLGKRPRPSMRRTTSMSGFSVDLNTTTVETPTPLDQPRQKQQVGGAHDGVGGLIVRRNTIGGDGDGDGFNQQRFLTNAASPRNNHRRNSGDFGEKEMAHFLRICGLCKRRLAPGRDIFMYRGDTAFCSQECRQQQMNHDDKKDKCAWPASKKEPSPSTTTTTTSTTMAMAMASEASSNGETAVAA